MVDSQFGKKTGNVKHNPDRADIEFANRRQSDGLQLDFDTDQGMKAGSEFEKDTTK